MLVSARLLGADDLQIPDHDLVHRRELGRREEGSSDHGEDREGHSLHGKAPKSGTYPLL